MITYYVDPNAAAGGDGTTANLSGATCAYASLSAWEAARQEDPLTESQEVICDSSGSSHLADTTACLIDGWTTDATHYLSIHTPSGSRHAGVWDTTHYRMDHTTNYGVALSLTEDYVRVDGLMLYCHPTTGTSTYAFRVYSTSAAGSTDIRLTNSIARSAKANALNIGSGGSYINNVIAYGAGASGINVSSSTAYIENCTVNANTTYGLTRTSGTVYAKNCYAGGNGTADYNGTITFTTCASADATDRTGVTKSIAYDTTNGAGHAGFTNITGGSEDFSIQSASSLVNAGTDVSADTGWKLGAVDIKGQSRSTWDIGAWEYVAPAGGISIPVLLDALGDY